MSSPKKVTTVDPDYEMTEVARERVRLKENRENKEKAEKARDIINCEFQMELNHRESQLQLIQQRLNHAQKTLHLLRYVLITSYYNDQDIQVQADEAPAEENLLPNKNRIHPALKKLLGNNATNYQFTTASPRKRIKLQHSKDVQLDPEKPNTSEIQEPSSQTSMEWEDSRLSSLSSEMKEEEAKEELYSGRNRKKCKYRVVVGNISKWMPSKSEEDKSTHKWMVYVRGSKENPDISHFVQKVVFYLHPSYQPNDVVELREPPFHLSRRGWGEFPLRVRIFFRCSLNKPVDIVHNLKLDKTYTGRQTLGNETLVNLFLYKDEKTLALTEEPPIIKQEIDPDVDVQSHAMPNMEHDYCFIQIKEEPQDEIKEPETERVYNPFSEHSYCANNSTQSVSSTSLSNFSEDQGTSLIYGLGDLEQNKGDTEEEVVLDDLKISTRKIIQNQLQRFIISNGTVIAIKKRRKPQESLLKKMFCKKYSTAVSLLNGKQNSSEVIQRPSNLNPTIDYEKYKIEFPSHRFKNVQEALPYLFKRLPLISELVFNINYRCTYPYAARSLDEYSRWNIGRRLSSEWFRAKMVLDIITSGQVPDYQSWTVKSVIMYARSHGYTPLCNYKIFKNKEYFPNMLNGEHDAKPLSKPKPELDESDVVVDIINCLPDPEPVKSSCSKQKLVDPKMDLACSYVKQTVLDAGIVLKPEDIIPGVLFNAVERILLQAVLNLAEDLIRRARASAVLRGNFQEETTIIEVEDVRRVLRERPEFKILLQSSRDA